MAARAQIHMKRGDGDAFVIDDDPKPTKKRKAAP
jgi:hypothetical protein